MNQSKIFFIVVVFVFEIKMENIQRQHFWLFVFFSLVLLNLFLKVMNVPF